jgi:hypothetical protein
LGAVDNEPDLHGRLIKLFESVHVDIGTNEISPLHFKSVPVDYPFTEKKPAKENLSAEGVLKFSWPLKHYEQIPSVVLFCVSFGVDWSAAEWTRRELAMQEKFSKLKATLSTRDVKVIVLMFKVGAGAMEKEVLDERISSFKRHAQTDSKSFLYFHQHELVSDNTTVRRLYKTIREGSFSYYAGNIKRFKSIEKTIGDKGKGPIEHMLLARYSFKIGFLNEFQGQMNYSLRFYRQCYQNLAISLESIDESLYEQIKAVGEIAHFKTCRLLLLQKNIEEACQQFRNHLLLFTKLYSMYPWVHSTWLANQYLVFCQLIDRFSVSDTLPYADRSFYYQNAARFTMDRMNHFTRSRKNVSSLFDINESPTAISVDSSVSSNGSSSGNDFSSLGISQLVQWYAQLGRWKLYEYRGRVFCPPKFVGGLPQLMGSTRFNNSTTSVGEGFHSSFGSEHSSYAFSATLASSAAVAVDDEHLYFDFLYSLEGRVAHHKLISELLIKALSSLPAASSTAGMGAVTTVGANPRRKALLLHWMAQQHVLQKEHETALTQLWSAVSLLQRERWHQAAMPLLLSVANTAIALGRAKDYIEAALSLYANSAYVYFSRHDLEELHLHILCLCYHSLRPSISRPMLLSASNRSSQNAEGDEAASAEAVSLQELPYVQNVQAFLTSSYVPLLMRTAYAQHCTSSTSSSSSPSPNSEESDGRLLANGHTLHFDRDCRLFEVDTYFNRASVELGETLCLSVTIKSLFLDALCFDELVLFSFDDIVQRTFLHKSLASTPSATSGQVVGNDEQSDVETVDLCLQPFQTLTFVVTWNVTETIFAKFLAKDAVFGIDRIELRWRHQEVSPDTQQPPPMRLLTCRVSACPTELHDLRRAHSQTTALANSGTSSVTASNSSTNSSSGGSVVNSANAGAQWSLKEVYSFWRTQPLHRPSVCRVVRPTQLLTLIYPPPLTTSTASTATTRSRSSSSGNNNQRSGTSEVELVQGLVQRLDLVLQAGEHDLRAVKVYLSSDMPATLSSTNSANDNSVFYLPDMPALLQREQQLQQQQSNNNNSAVEKDAEEEEEEAIGYYPLRLNAAQQPLLPLIIEGTITAHSKIYLPVFVRPSASLNPGQYSIHLSVECVPTDVMTSAAVAGDYSIPVTLYQPWVARHSLRCHEDNQVFAPTLQVARDTASSSSSSLECWGVATQTSLSLDTSLRCLHTLSTPTFAALYNKHSSTAGAGTASAGIGVAGDERVGGATPQPPLVPTSASQQQQMQEKEQIQRQNLQIRRVEHLYHSKETECVRLQFGPESNTFGDILLQREETFHRSILFSAQYNSSNTSHSNKKPSNNTENEVSLGEYEVQWRDRSVSPLRPSPQLLDALYGHLEDLGTAADIGFFPRVASRFHWLLFAHPRPDVAMQPTANPSSSKNSFTDVLISDAETEVSDSQHNANTGTPSKSKNKNKKRQQNNHNNKGNSQNSDQQSSETTATVEHAGEMTAKVDLQPWASALQRAWSEVVYSEVDRRVSVTGIARLSLPRLSVRAREFVVSLATPRQGSVAQGDAFDLRLSVRRPAQPRPSVSRGYPLGYETRGVEKLRVSVWLHEDFLITGRTNGLIEVVEDLPQNDEGVERAEEERSEVWQLRCVALRSGWVSLPRIQLLWDRSSRLVNTTASQSSNSNSVSSSNSTAAEAGVGGGGGGGGVQGVQCIFDLGERDELRPKLFVLPNTPRHTSS